MTFANVMRGKLTEANEDVSYVDMEDCMNKNKNNPNAQEFCKSKFVKKETEQSFRQVDSRARGNMFRRINEGFDVSQPFADYKDFEDCVSKNQSKSDPQAYCATIKKQVEGK